MLETFQKLKDNPQGRVVEFKYTRMGEMAEVQTVGDGASEVEEQPEGPLFGQAELMADGGHRGLVGEGVGEYFELAVAGRVFLHNLCPHFLIINLTEIVWS